jgi:hypothetical protein
MVCSLRILTTPTPAGDDAHAHGFEEHEEEVGIMKDGRMSSVSASAL